MQPLTLLAYRYTTAALAPVAHLALRQRALRGKEDRERLAERLGRSSLARPTGELVWIHGASIGECVAALPLVHALLEQPDRFVLVTSGTLTSAAIMRDRLPQRAFHQFVPVDVPDAVARFLDHWRPAAGLFVDSEIWPNLLAEAHARGVQLVLINGRMSARSFTGWRRVPGTARRVLSYFRVCLAQDRESAERLEHLGAADVRISGSLKADAPPDPVDPEKLAALESAVANRPILLAASTHPGEDETILPAHDALRRDHPDLLTIVVPRHPQRGAEIGMLCGSRASSRRSEGALPSNGDAIYIADTIGELSLFYRLAGFAFMGGSLVPHGGQNPLEAARLERPVMAGPHTENFKSAYEAIFSAQGCGSVRSCAEITALARVWLSDPDRARTLGLAAAVAAAGLGGALARTRAVVEELLAHART
jgi:3-deoxy-D-manno-octulosonic-acid transferase